MRLKSDREVKDGKRANATMGDIEAKARAQYQEDLRDAHQLKQETTGAWVRHRAWQLLGRFRCAVSHSPPAGVGRGVEAALQRPASLLLQEVRRSSAACLPSFGSISPRHALQGDADVLWRGPSGLDAGASNACRGPLP